MTDNEQGFFSDWFDVLAVTHRLQAREDMRAKMKSEYFDVLRAYPLAIVESAYQTLRRRSKKWPTPADWCEALPPVSSVSRLAPMTREEQRESDHAESLGYEAEGPCACALCVAEGVVMPPRYVPRRDREGNFYERRHPVRQGRAVLLGRWIHGAELRSWWVARANFYEQLHALKPAVAALLEREQSKPHDNTTHDVSE